MEEDKLQRDGAKEEENSKDTGEAQDTNTGQQGKGQDNSRVLDSKITLTKQLAKENEDTTPSKKLKALTRTKEYRRIREYYISHGDLPPQEDINKLRNTYLQDVPNTITVAYDNLIRKKKAEKGAGWKKLKLFHEQFGSYTPLVSDPVIPQTQEPLLNSTPCLAGELPVTPRPLPTLLAPRPTYTVTPQENSESTSFQGDPAPATPQTPGAATLVNTMPQTTPTRAPSLSQWQPLM